MSNKARKLCPEYGKPSCPNIDLCCQMRSIAAKRIEPEKRDKPFPFLYNIGTINKMGFGNWNKFEMKINAGVKK